jgi:hypothetical protein
MSRPPEPGAYLNELAAELTGAGVRGARRRRILAEFADHLASDPDAELGAPAPLARQFADELGTSYARDAALAAFAALALAGVLVGIRAVALLPFRAAGFGTLDTFSLLVAALAGQVALVAGGLGLVRALRLRRRDTIPTGEAVVLARRAGVGLAAGAVTVIAFPLTQSYRAHPGALQIGHPTANVLWPLASGIGLAALAIAVPIVLRSARLRPQVEPAHPGGTLLSDLGPLEPAASRVTGGSVTRLAILTAAALAAVLACAGVVGGDPYDGVLRGLVEGGACLAGFLALGRYLGLRG